ncbi:MAG: (Fe-S)-binding protein [Bacteroidota bacterium]
MNFDWFALPFTIGIFILTITLVVKYFRWFRSIDLASQRRFWRGFFSLKIFGAVKEIILECLLHRKIFKVNRLLGFMHMTLAFGWFLLIVAGTIESKLFSHRPFNMPYDPIFFKFFEHEVSGFAFSNGFIFMMDLLLLLILVAVSLAWLKRMSSRIFGLKRTTKQRPFDRIAITTLWLIFPMRLLAESSTAGLYHNGGFLTNNVGDFLAAFLPLQTLEEPMWWGYSIALGLFFTSLPYSRYMHIPTEVGLIFLRRFGVKHGPKYDGFAAFEVNSCSRCGVCVDRCMLLTSLGIKETAPAYFLFDVRNKLVTEQQTFNCLMCRRCEEFCPVGIKVRKQRSLQRKQHMPELTGDFRYLNAFDYQKKGKVAYFAGCMGHLTPAVIRATLALFKQANVDFVFLDEQGSVCCGRPYKLAGSEHEAIKLTETTKRLIKESGATALVTSCPICLKTFRNFYDLDIPVYHHSEYILDLVKNKKLVLQKQNTKVVYHDPCELGRGLQVYDEPRELIRYSAELTEAKENRENGACCGGSLANLHITPEQKKQLAADVCTNLKSTGAEMIITACPLCKKSFAKEEDVPVMDIAELTLFSLKAELKKKKEKEMV